jgi:hypothetical protein
MMQSEPLLVIKLTHTHRLIVAIWNLSHFISIFVQFLVIPNYAFTSQFHEN